MRKLLLTAIIAATGLIPSHAFADCNIGFDGKYWININERPPTVNGRPCIAHVIKKGELLSLACHRLEFMHVAVVKGGGVWVTLPGTDYRSELKPFCKPTAFGVDGEAACEGQPGGC